MAVGSCITGATLLNADFFGVPGMGVEWYVVFASRVPVTLSFDVVAFVGLATPTVNNIEVHAWCPPGEVNWEVHNPANWTPFGTGLPETGWKWFAVRGTALAIEFYALSDNGSAWISNPAHNILPEELLQLRIAPSYVNPAGMLDGWLSKVIVKRGSFTLANMLAETRKLGIASDAADTIFYNPFNDASDLTNQASPSGGSAAYALTVGTHSGTPLDVPDNSPLFVDDDLIKFVQLSPQVPYTPTLSQACPFSVPVTAGNYVLVYVSQYTGGNTITGVSVGATAGVLVATATNIPALASQTTAWLVGPVVSGDPTVTFDGINQYGTIRAQEFSGIGAIEFVQNGGINEPPVTYPALSGVGCLAVALSLDGADFGPGYWDPPPAYTLGLDVATWTLSASGASAWRALTSAAGDTVTWATPNIGAYSQALVIFAPAAAPSAQRNTFFGISP